MIEPTEGQILIDQLDIADLGLHDLRSNLTIIPQVGITTTFMLMFLLLCIKNRNKLKNISRNPTKHET